MKTYQAIINLACSSEYPIQTFVDNGINILLGLRRLCHIVSHVFRLLLIQVLKALEDGRHQHFVVTILHLITLVQLEGERNK